jgi:menaquinone-dependent protoporphyrinogen IX oxidase
MKGIIIYQGKYGATEQYAQWLAGSLNISLIKASAVTPAILAGYDLVILGSSVYVGKLVIAKWLKHNLGELARKKIFLFIVCGTPAEAKDEQQKIIEKNVDPAIRKTTSVFFLPGRCIISKLSWTDRFVLKLGAMLARDPKQKANMNRGFDRMDKKSLSSLIAAVNRQLRPGPVSVTN